MKYKGHDYTHRQLLRLIRTLINDGFSVNVRCDIAGYEVMLAEETKTGRWKLTIKQADTPFAALKKALTDHVGGQDNEKRL